VLIKEVTASTEKSILFVRTILCMSNYKGRLGMGGSDMNLEVVKA